MLLLLLLTIGRQRPIPGSSAVPDQALATDRSSRSPRPSLPDAVLEERLARLDVPATDVMQGAMLWSNTFPERAVRYAALVNGANVPIHYFGLCVDQDGKPLAGVNVTMRIRQWQGGSPINLVGASLRYPKVSDAKGLFELSGVKADVATVESATLSGYEWIRTGSPARDFTDSADIVPTMANPVVLRFWKKRPAEPLFAATPPMRQKVACDRTPSTYSLKTGLKVAEKEGPLVRFLMERDPVTMNSQIRVKPSWQLTIEIPGGGLQQTFTNMPFIAPADGYARVAVFGCGADDSNWAPRTNALLFFRAADGSFGRLEIDLTATTDGPAASLNWKSYLNPSGSRVLEYDPAKQIKVSTLQSPPPVGFQPQLTSPPPSAAPVFPQQPPGFQAPTNRGKAFTPPVPTRPQPQ